MKKIFCFLIGTFIVFVFNLFFIASAETQYKNIKNTNIQIAKENKKYTLIDKTTKQKILSGSYKRIKHHKIDNVNIFVADIANGLFELYSPEGLYSDYLTKYIKFNNEINSVKFENYPSNGLIVYKYKSEFGLIIIKDNSIIVSTPVYKKFYAPDDNSLIYEMLGISFSDFKDMEFVTEIDNLNKKIKSVDVKEKVIVKPDVTTIEYLGVENNNLNKYISHRSKSGEAFFFMKKLIKKDKHSYKDIPNTIITLNVNNNAEINDISNQTIYLAKKNNKYGFVDEENNVIVPFEFVSLSDKTNDKILKKTIKAKLRKMNIELFPVELLGVLSEILLIPFLLLAFPFNLMFFAGI
ncbi:hypothetical protein IJ182_01170 [bacterium]|nr:hypothetical protein [bacterium]